MNRDVFEASCSRCVLHAAADVMKPGAIRIIEYVRAVRMRRVFRQNLVELFADWDRTDVMPFYRSATFALDVDFADIQINILPREVKQFSLSETCIERGGDKWIQTLRSGRLAGIK